MSVSTRSKSSASATKLLRTPTSTLTSPSPSPTPAPSPTPRTNTSYDASSELTIDSEAEHFFQRTQKIAQRREVAQSSKRSKEEQKRLWGIDAAEAAHVHSVRCLKCMDGGMVLVEGIGGCYVCGLVTSVEGDGGSEMGESELLDNVARSETESERPAFQRDLRSREYT